jgi:rhamnulokinase
MDESVKKSHFLAFDIGAESGRTILGTLKNQRLQIKELSRFPNGMVNILGHLHWNIFRLFEEMKNGLRECASDFTSHPDGIAFDTWGVDFGLLAKDGSILGLPFAYRDSRTQGMMDEFFKRIPRERVYQLTGIQMMPFNSIYQLYSMVRDKSPLLEAASDILFMPDLFNYLFTGEKASEFTFATTTQLYNPTIGEWDGELLGALELSRSKLQQIVPPGTIGGNLQKDIADETGLTHVPVIACASHDTGSAVAAVPAEGKEWAYISSGTWSLMGVEIDKPNLSEQAMAFNFTNEGGVESTFRFLKNIMGLWLVQQCKKAWDKEYGYSYAELAAMAEAAKPFIAIVDPDDGEFLNPPDMPEAIRQYCGKTGQSIPAFPAEIARCAFESLALKYRLVLDQLREVYPNPIKIIHVIGGGAKNEYLNQFTANATGLPVVAGPAEATAIGNIMIQALALGHVTSLSEIRRIIRNSFPMVRYEPQQVEQWDAAYVRFKEILQVG